MLSGNRRAIKLQIEEHFQEVLNDLGRFTSSELRTYAFRLVLDAQYYMLRLCRWWTFSWPTNKNNQADFLFVEFGKVEIRRSQILREANTLNRIDDRRAVMTTDILRKIDSRLERLAVILRDLPRTPDRLRVILLLLAARREEHKLIRAETTGVHVA